MSQRQPYSVYQVLGVTSPLVVVSVRSFVTYSLDLRSRLWWSRSEESNVYCFRSAKVEHTKNRSNDSLHLFVLGYSQGLLERKRVVTGHPWWSGLEGPYSKTLVTSSIVDG